MATLFRSHDGHPTYYTNSEVIYDAAGRACFYIVDNYTLHDCITGKQHYWINGNYLFQHGGSPAFYFDADERAEELKTIAGFNEETPEDRRLAHLIIDGTFPEEIIERLENAEKVRRIIKRNRDQSQLQQVETPDEPPAT
jgi:hypothetical protein